MDANKKIHHEEPNIAGDRLNILILTLISTLNYVPRITSNAIALILRNRNVSYVDQAEFSLVQYSNCSKLLWSPMVDCFYWKKVGRRRSWIIPSQYLIGIVYFFVSIVIEDWLGSEDGTRQPKTHFLTITFFTCIFISSVQGVAVDAWGLTMLKRRNIGYAGTCGNLGWTLCQFLGYVLFIVLCSKDFYNKFRSVPRDDALISFSDFILIWSVVLIGLNTFLWFKKEIDIEEIENDTENRLSLTESYACLWKIINIKPIRHLCLILFTYEIGAAPTNGVAFLKLVDAGVSTDTLALMEIPCIPFEFILPFALSRFFMGKRALRAFVVTCVIKLVFNIVYAVFIYSFRLYAQDDNVSSVHYCLMLLIYNGNVLTDHMMYVALWSFLSRISDPRFGGMYVSLFSAVTTLGNKWPISACFRLMDVLTIYSCDFDGAEEMSPCLVIFDGYYTETIILTLFGIIWLYCFKRKIYELEDMDNLEWRVKTDSTKL